MPQSRSALCRDSTVGVFYSAKEILRKVESHKCLCANSLMTGTPKPKHTRMLCLLSTSTCFRGPSEISEQKPLSGTTTTQWYHHASPTSEACHEYSRAQH